MGKKWHQHVPHHPLIPGLSSFKSVRRGFDNRWLAPSDILQQRRGNGVAMAVYKMGPIYIHAQDIAEGSAMEKDQNTITCDPDRYIKNIWLMRNGP